MSNAYVIELFTSRRAKRQRHFWRIRRGGRVLATSEGYTRAAKRNRTARRVFAAMAWGSSRNGHAVAMIRIDAKGQRLPLRAIETL